MERSRSGSKDVSAAMPERDPREWAEELPFEMGDEVPEFFRRKAELELHDTPERRVQALRQMRDLMTTDKLLCDQELTDEFLLPYLRARKFNVQRAFTQLRNYATMRKKYPEMFTDFRLESLENAMDSHFLRMLPLRCQDGCTVPLIEVANWDPDALPVEEFKKVLLIFLMGNVMQEPMTQINGFKSIVNVKGNALPYLRYLTPSNLYLMYHGTEACVPGRYKEVHIVNNNFAFRTAWMILKHFFTDKLRKRVHFHSSNETLLDFFPKSILPVKYGGELKDYSLKSWMTKTMDPDNIEKITGGKWNYGT